VADAFEFSLTVRYMEVDAQGVVFNAWYLTYFDEAFTAFLESRGLGYQALRDGGLDFQLVHADLSWKAGLRFRDRAVIAGGPHQLRDRLPGQPERRRAGLPRAHRVRPGGDRRVRQARDLTRARGSAGSARAALAALKLPGLRETRLFVLNGPCFAFS
jgi:hypothetical protein